MILATVCLFLASLTFAEDRVLRLAPPQRDLAMRNLLPKVASAPLREVLNNPRLMVYSERDMPRAYQNWSTVSGGFHDPYYNISASKPMEPVGNADEFPWKHPFGTHRSENVYNFKFILLPTDERGVTRPIVYFMGERSEFLSNSTPAYSWLFPVGTIVGEVLYQRAPDGADVVFELRTRTRRLQDWTPAVYRPYPTADDLVRGIEKIPAWSNDVSLTKLYNHLSIENRSRVMRMTDENHQRRAFYAETKPDELPSIPPNTVKKLLDTEFKEATGSYWRPSEKGSPSAPTTKAAFHIVPAGYDGGFVEVSRESCFRCHQDTNQSTMKFDMNRDWYGNTRGSDTVFTFLPVDPGCISHNGTNLDPVFRRDLLAAGVIAPMDPRIHSRDVYRRIPGVR
jgi:hypothetical protein